jgi:hypothetical protein
MPNPFDYLADTNPARGSPKSEFRSQRSKANGLRIDWQGGTQAGQFLRRSRNLGASGTNWVSSFTNHPLTPLQMNLFDLLGTKRTLFYHVRAVRE